MNTTLNAVYYVESSNPDKKYNPIAIRPEFISYKTDEFIEQRCEWRDTDRGAYFFFQEISMDKQTPQDVPRKFKLIEKDGEEITFTFMTADLFNEKVSSKVWKQPQFLEDSGLQKYYLDKFS